MLNQTLEAYGYIKPRAASAADPTSLDNLKEVLNENERLKDEMRTLIEAAVRDRQLIEYGQRDTVQLVPDLMMSQQYKTLIEEYGRKMSKESDSTHQQLSLSKKELDVQRERVIRLIQEKSTLESELNAAKLQKKEKEEVVKHHERKVKEVELHLEVSRSKLEEATLKIERQFATIEEANHKMLGLKETISKQRQDLESMQVAVMKTEQMRDNLEKDLKEGMGAQRALSVKVETLVLEKQELRQLLQMKSNLI